MKALKARGFLDSPLRAEQAGSKGSLTFDEIEDCFPEGACALDETGMIAVTAQWLHDFAQAIAAKAHEDICGAPPTGHEDG